MIAYLSGQIIDQSENEIVVLCRGVGYQVICSQNTLDDISERKVIQLWIHTHVKEDLFQLYGFSSKIEKKLFLSLLKVNGIGPKLAIRALSGASLDAIIDAIESQNVSALTKLPKIGKKTAEQMILTLKGQLVIDSPSEGRQLPRQQQEIISALINLGFQNARVEEVVQQLPGEVEFEIGVRESLKKLSAL